MTFKPLRTLSLLAILCSGALTLTGSTPVSEPAVTAAGAPRVTRLRPAKAMQYDHHKMYALSAAFYDVRGRWSSRLTLNNKGADAMQPEVTLFSHNGRPYTLPDVVVGANNFLDIDLAAVARQAGGGFERGSVRVRYHGDELEMGAQVVISDLQRGLQFDEQLSYASAAGPNRREAVWWLPSARASLSLVVTNLTDAAVTIRGEIRSASGRGAAGAAARLDEIRLEPHELREVRLRAGDRRAGALGGLSIEHDGPAGAVLARGFVEDARSGYSAPILFTNPAGAKTASYHGGGLRLEGVNGGTLEPVVVARNVSATPTTVAGRLLVSTSDGQIAMFNLPATPLAAQQTAAVDLGQAWSEALAIPNRTGVGVEFEYTSAPGSVIMTASAVSGDRQHVFRVPLIDPETVPSSTGGYMWRADATTSTMVYLKNVTNAPQKYLLQLSFEGGAYAPGLKTLQPGETVALDLRALRDAQVPDAWDRTIPAHVTSGQVHWSAKGRVRAAMIGRAEFVNVASGVSASYACINCCPDNPYESWTIDDPIIATVGAWVDVSLTMRDIDCYDTVLEAYSLSWYDLSWSIGNTNIATGDNNASVTGVSAGSTTLYATYDAEWWTKEGSEFGWHCAPTSYPVAFQAPVQVQCAVPTNFQQVGPGVDIGSGTLEFTYSWSSSVGSISAISQCEIGERVSGYSSNPLPSPPFKANYTINDPTEIQFGASSGSFGDRHSTTGPFVQPFQAATVTAQQIYRYRCPCNNNNAWVTVMGPLTITREVGSNGSGGWKFQITKSGSSATINPLQ